ncbi:MAG: ester cyclase [Pseudomonadota bacterium]
MKDFDPKYRDLPDYIIGVTKEIWEDRGIHTLRKTYAPDILVRSPMGIQRGNEDVIATTMATCHAFPDRQLYAEDVIWSDNATHGYLSSHRLTTTGTYTGHGPYGPARGQRFCIKILADCAAETDVIYDEWLIRDTGGLVRQLGTDPDDYARSMIDAGTAPTPLTLANDEAGRYGGTGNDNAWGARYAEDLRRIMDADLSGVLSGYDRAVMGQYASAGRALGREEVAAVWTGLRAAFPSATFTIHHQIGMDADMLSPRAAIRWSLDGNHDGWGAFGAPTGRDVHVMGMCHAEYGPWGLRREVMLIDEVAVWLQILG